MRNSKHRTQPTLHAAEQPEEAPAEMQSDTDLDTDAAAMGSQSRGLRSARAMVHGCWGLQVPNMQLYVFRLAAHEAFALQHVQQQRCPPPAANVSGHTAHGMLLMVGGWGYSLASILPKDYPADRSAARPGARVGRMWTHTAQR